MSRTVTHVSKRGPRFLEPRECFVCKAHNPRPAPMPLDWRDHLLEGQHVFTCSADCRLQKGLK